MIYHITSQEAWTRANQAGQYEGDTLAVEGFIHCSTAEQVIPVANALFTGQTGLVLLCIIEEKVAAEIRYESPPADDASPAQRFPHIYGPLNIAAVTAAVDFPPGEGGLFNLPGSLPR